MTQFKDLRSLLSDTRDNVEKLGSALTQLNLKQNLEIDMLTDEIYENFGSVEESFKILKVGEWAGALGIVVQGSHVHRRNIRSIRWRTDTSSRTRVQESGRVKEFIKYRFGFQRHHSIIYG